MVGYLVAMFLSVFGWSLLLVMVFMQAVLGGAHDSGRDRSGKLASAQARAA